MLDVSDVQCNVHHSDKLCIQTIVFSCHSCCAPPEKNSCTQDGEPKIALSLYNRQQSQVKFLVPHPVVHVMSQSYFCTVTSDKYVSCVSSLKITNNQIRCTAFSQEKLAEQV